MWKFWLPDKYGVCSKVVDEIIYLVKMGKSNMESMPTGYACGC